MKLLVLIFGLASLAFAAWQTVGRVFFGEAAPPLFLSEGYSGNWTLILFMSSVCALVGGLFALRAGNPIGIMLVPVGVVLTLISIGFLSGMQADGPAADFAPIIFALLSAGGAIGALTSVRAR